MRRSFLVSGLAVGAMTLGFFGEREAAACGGCFHPPTPPNQVASDITDERMLLSVTPAQTTLYDQIRYAGSPSAFAWVLPIHGTVTVGLSADVLFDSIDAVTATQIVPPASQCPPPPSDCGGSTSSGCGASSASSASFGSGGPENGGSGTVTVTKQENVGPYETVQLHATDSSALDAWLQQNGFSIPADVLPVVNEYVTEGFDFLAMKLVPNQGVQSMRPVRVTMQGASVSLPLRMAAIGTGATVGITIWVVSDGRYEPQNFPMFHIEDSALVWDWSTSSSNYTTLRAQGEAKLGGKGWELESSIEVANEVLTGVILSGGQYNGAGGYGSAAPSDATQDYLPVGGEDGGAAETADQVRDDDVSALFATMGPNVRVTRIRSDISHAAMTTDFILQASADQSEVSNVRNVTASVNEQCPIYDSCNVVGTGSAVQAVAISGTTSAGAPHKSGCVASSQQSSGGTGRFAILAGLACAFVARLARRRDRRGAGRNDRGA